MAHQNANSNTWKHRDASRYNYSFLYTRMRISNSRVSLRCNLNWRPAKRDQVLNISLVYLFYSFAAFAKSLRFLLFQVSFHKNSFCYDLNATIAEFATILRQTRIKKKSLRKLISSFKKKKKSTLIYLFMYTMKY